MATLCLNASPQILQQLCCYSTYHLQGDLCHCLHKRCLKALQALVTISAHHVLQNSP
jgi:hypothetical protein